MVKITMKTIKKISILPYSSLVVLSSYSLFGKVSNIVSCSGRAVAIAVVIRAASYASIFILIIYIIVTKNNNK